MKLSTAIARFIITFSIVAGIALSPVWASENTGHDESIGKVTRIQKSAIAIQDAMSRALMIGTDIFRGDIISTGKGARVEVRLKDNSTFTLGERTHFVVEEFLAGDTDNNIVLRMIQGAFIATSGELLKTANASMVIETPTATIGIRGTTAWGGDINGKFSIALMSGKSIIVENKNGSVVIDTPGFGTIVNSKNNAPTTPKIWSKSKINKAHNITGFSN